MDTHDQTIEIRFTIQGSAAELAKIFELLQPYITEATTSSKKKGFAALLENNEPNEEALFALYRSCGFEGRGRKMHYRGITPQMILENGPEWLTEQGVRTIGPLWAERIFEALCSVKDSTV